MAVLRTPIKLPGSRITQQTVESLNDFKRVERGRPLKLPLPGRKSLICAAILILSALAGAITPWVLLPW
jgi:hypothetical protein